MTVLAAVNRQPAEIVARPLRSYLIINLFLAGIILLIMIYSLVFSPDTGNYPIVCHHEKLTGQKCVSCGLSHSFSLILRGRIDEAFEWNIYGMRVFLFFAGQLVMRMVFSGIYSKYPDYNRQLILYDIIGSSVIFLLAFMQFFVYIFKFL